MIGIFKQKNPGNALLLLLYGLVLKFPLFLHPAMPVPDPGDNYLYRRILELLDPFTSHSPGVFSFLAFLLFFTQATLLNRISNTLKFFQRPNFLVGMAYLLVTSFMPEWNSFSAPLLVNSLAIWVLYRMISLYNNNRPKTAIYNVAVLAGILPMIYSPSIVLVLLVFFALIMFRPMLITEWLVALLGIITPFYFIFLILFLTDQWNLGKVIPAMTFHLPRIQVSWWVAGTIVLMTIPFVTGGYQVQDNLNKMQIHIRKAWSLLLFYLIVAVVIMIFNPGNNYMHWLMVAVPLATFHTATYYYMTTQWFSIILHWVSFLFCIVVNYGILNKL